MTKKYTGKLLWLDGKANFIKKQTLVDFMAQYPEGTYFEIVATPIGDINAHPQSKLYHEWCDLIAEDLGWDSGMELHHHFKATYNSGKSTKGMDTKEWSIYMNKVLAFAGEHNIKLPAGKTD